MEGASGGDNAPIDPFNPLAALAWPSFNRRLTRNAVAPLIVAFSGGGDSLALLLAANAWADAAGRRLIAVTVDHRLQTAGAGWTAGCAARCRCLGVQHRALAWTSDKPATGLAAAARHARHALIADAARSAGARVILMGHTADDRLEARLMRAAGGSVPEPREWSPSPLWPQGRDLFILRPLIDVRRGEIRLALAQAGETWIDDPANEDLRSPRARARAALASRETSNDENRDIHPMVVIPAEARLREGPGPRSHAHGETIRCSPLPKAMNVAPGSRIGGRAAFRDDVRGGAGKGDSDLAIELLGHLTEGAAGDLAIPRALLRQGPRDSRRALLGAAILCAAGTDRPARGARLDPLVGRLAATGPFVATLAGARIAADEVGVRIVREAGDRRRLGAADILPAPGVAIVWDGRFEITASTPGLRVTMLRGAISRLDRAARQAVKAVAAAARPSLPAVIDAEGRVTCPSLARDPRVAVRSLILLRLAGAVGAIPTEAAIGRVAERLATS